MVWILTEQGGEILNEETFQRIYLELPDPDNLDTEFKFYAQINDKEFLICRAYVPDDIKKFTNDEWAKDWTKDDLSDINGSNLITLAEELIEKLMLFIFEAKKENNNQLIDLNKKLAKSGFLENYRIG